MAEAALAGLDAGEAITIPTLVAPSIRDDMEAVRGRFLGDVIGGKVAALYLGQPG